MTTSPLTEALKSTSLEFTIWHDPIAERNGIPADSDDALVTGRDAIFVPCECVLGAAR